MKSSYSYTYCGEWCIGASLEVNATSFATLLLLLFTNYISYFVDLKKQCCQGMAIETTHRHLFSHLSHICGLFYECPAWHGFPHSRTSAAWCGSSKYGTLNCSNRSLRSHVNVQPLSQHCTTLSSTASLVEELPTWLYKRK